MSGQCCQNQPKFDGVSADFKRALWIVIAINGVMFVVEMIAGRISESQALQADALDFFADTITYGLSLYVIGMSIKVRSSIALLKGFSLAGMGLWVLGSTVYQSINPSLPQAEVMGLIGFLALLANSLSVLLLIRYRNGDANVRSAWLCSRNDAIGNIAVMLAGSGVWVTNAAWPDLIVASLMAGLFFWSSLQIIRLANEEYQSSV
jgi:cation diffusion facilitator family transporter